MTESSRVLDLACDRAIWGLDPAREMELAALLPPGEEPEPSLALAAAAIALAELEIDEPLPAHLADRVFAAAMSAAPARSVVGSGATPTSGVPVATPTPSGTPRSDLTPVASLPTAHDGPRSPSEPGPASAAPGSRGSVAQGSVVPLAPRRSALAWMGWVAAAACLLLAAGTYWKLRTVGEVVATASAAQKRDRMLGEAKDAVRIPWAPTKDPAAQGASGEVVWSNARQEGYMTFRGIAANDRTKEQYQLWIFDGERDEKFPVDGGVFDVGAAQVGPNGEVVVPITAKVVVGTPKLFAVTVEKPGGVVVSKRERIAVTATVPG